MIVIISKSSFVDLIAKIQKIVPTKPIVPILSSILIEAQNNQLLVSATDFTTSIQCFCEATVIEEGSVALPARQLFQLIKELSPQVKICVSADHKAEIISGSSSFKINGTSKAMFPTLPGCSSTTQVALSATQLHELLSRSVFAASRDDSRPTLMGISVRLEKNIATFIGTDAKRLAKIESSVDLPPSFEGSYILPLKAVEEMLHLLDSSDHPLSLGFSHDKVFFEYGPVTLISKLISGQFPDTARVIPTSSTYSIPLHREELIALLRQISVFTPETTGAVHFTFSNGQVELHAAQSDLGEGNVSMPANYSGPKLEIVFNGYFFLDALRHSKDSIVTLLLNNSHSPGIIRDSSSASCLLMPLRFPGAEPSEGSGQSSSSEAFDKASLPSGIQASRS